MKKLALNQIIKDAGTQARYFIDDTDVARYVEDMQDGVKFPPIVVFSDGDSYWLADGFHRVFAAMELDKNTIASDIKTGTLRDAILYACGANTNHGFPRKNEDKRKAVETLLKDAEWSKWSDREIARRCCVSDRLVNNVRKSLSAKNSQIEGPRTVKRGDTEYEMDTSGIGNREPTPSEAFEAFEVECNCHTVKCQDCGKVFKL